jgi:hypothetical protein
MGELYRAFTPKSYNEEKDDKGTVKNRSVRGTLATDAAVRVYDWDEDAVIYEILPMASMELPGNRQLPLLDNHTRWGGSSSVKGSVRNITVNADGASMDGDVYFARSAGDIADLVQEGHLTDFSAGYNIDPKQTQWLNPGERCNVGGREYVNSMEKGRVAVRTWWKPFEISTTPIGADARAKVRNNTNNLNERGANMPDKVEGQNPAPAATVDVEAIRSAAVREALEKDRQRRSDITAAAGEMGIEESVFRAFLDDPKITVEEASRKMIVIAREKLKAAPVGGDSSHVATGADETDKFRAAAEDALCLRGGLPEKRMDPERLASIKKSEYRGIGGMQALAKECLIRNGVKGVSRMEPKEIADAILLTDRFTGSRATVAQASGDFAYVLKNSANKFFLGGFEMAPTTYQRWVGKQPLNDFKQATLFKISNYSDLKWTKEGKNPEWGRFSDKAEYVTLFKYESAYSLSYEAIVNDDKSAFSSIPSAIGNSVARKKDREAYHYLIYGTTEPTGNATTGSIGPSMNEKDSDGTAAMFTATRGNLVTGAAPSVSAFNTAASALSKIKMLAPDGESQTIYSQALPRFILCATEKRGFWQQIIGSPTSKDFIDGSVTANSNAYIINPFQDSVDVIGTPYLSEVDSGYPWYMLADSSQMGHIVLATLAGEEAPQLRSQPSEIGQARGIVWDIMAIYALGAADWRGAVRNPGH